jgi:hypothetical protein
MERLPISIAIDPETNFTIAINPSSFHFQDGSGEMTVVKGKYRILFSYRFEPQREMPEPHSVYSSEFDYTP